MTLNWIALCIFNWRCKEVCCYKECRYKEGPHFGKRALLCAQYLQTLIRWRFLCFLYVRIAWSSTYIWIAKILMQKKLTLIGYHVKMNVGAGEGAREQEGAPRSCNSLLSCENECWGRWGNYRTAIEQEGAPRSCNSLGETLDTCSNWIVLCVFFCCKFELFTIGLFCRVQLHQNKAIVIDSHRIYCSSKWLGS